MRYWDVRSEESISKAIEHVRSLTEGSLDTLINNAGMGYSIPVTDMDMNKVRELFELNVFSIVSVTRAFLPLLLCSARNDTIIANNTSGMGLLGCGMPSKGVTRRPKPQLSA